MLIRIRDVRPKILVDRNLNSKLFSDFSNDCLLRRFIRLDLTSGKFPHISGGTAVTYNISTPGRYTGVFPSTEHAEWQRNAAVVSQLSTLRKRLRALERG